MLSVFFFVLAGVTVGADTRIKTPFQVVPLWSDEMLAYLMGVKQAACSGPEASKCERLNTGVCDGRAYFTVGPSTRQGLKTALPRTTSKQTESANPQYFALEIWHAASSMNA